MNHNGYAGSQFAELDAHNLLMVSQLYNWKRFWCPREEAFSLEDNGYLIDPEAEWGGEVQPNVVAFDQIQNVPCLLLLGEPGIGKSTAMESERDSIKSRAVAGEAKVRRLDLRSYGDEQRLCHALFDHPKFIGWKRGDHSLHLFLDSWDECLLRIETVSALLIEELSKQPVDGLALRIACRTADLPKTLEDGLRTLWSENLGVYELVPLRKRDVREAATVNDIDADSFLEEVDRQEAVPFAIKPVTLRFLLNKYQKDRKLPHRQTELYAEGCRLLCEDPNIHRRDTGQTGLLSSTKRLLVAHRVAAITVFANKYAIWTGLDQGDVPDEDVTASQVSGGAETFNGQTIEIDEAAVRDVLHTGLFTSRGENRHGWAHHTYAEFLAASYLNMRCRSVTRLMSVLTHPGDPESKIPPQLSETAAWTASFSGAVFQRIMQSEPELLLRSDVATAEVSDRAGLVDGLLNAFDQGTVWDLLELRGYYRKLAHAELLSQLRPSILDKSKNIVSRRFAIDVVEACKIEALLDDLATLALDNTDEYRIRVRAAFAISKIGDDAARKRLLPLTRLAPAEDPDDEFKGYALISLWPSLITSRDLFHSLTEPQKSSFIGGYDRFLYTLADSLARENLIDALKFAKRHPPDQLSSFGLLSGRILLKALNFADYPEIAKSLAKTLTSWLESDFAFAARASSEPWNFLKVNEEKRRNVLKQVLKLLPKSSLDSARLAVANLKLNLITSRDTQWLLKEFTASRSLRKKKVIAGLVHHVWDQSDTRQTDAILVASRDCAVLQEEFASLLTPVDLNSEQAKRLRQQHLELNNWEPPAATQTLNPPPAQRIERFLTRCEAGDINAFWQLNMEMTLEEDSTHYGDDIAVDLKSLPGWTNSEAGKRSRIVECSRQYVLQRNPETSTWLGKNVRHRPALAGYRAFRLLVDEDSAFVTGLSTAVWERWAPAILSFPHSEPEKDEVHKQLVSLAYSRAANQGIEVLQVLIKRDNAEHGHIFRSRSIFNCLVDDRLSAAILEEIKGRSLKPDMVEELFGLLLQHGNGPVDSYARELVKGFPYSREDVRSFAVAAAKALLEYAGDAGWTVVWPAIQADTKFARETLEAFVYPRLGQTSVAARLSEDHVADLYLWLYREYPLQKTHTLKMSIRSDPGKVWDFGGTRFSII